MFLKCNPNDFYLFAKLVELGGFTAAAKALNLPKSRLSRRISELEAILNSRLIQRTTRSINLTEAGHALYQHCKAMIVAAQAGEDAVRTRHGATAGLVRVSAPVAIGQHIIPPIITKFLEQYPDVSVELNVSNQNTDLIADGYDLAIRGTAGRPTDSSLVKISICKIDWVFVASPEFIKREGFPHHPLDLHANQMLLYSRHRTPSTELSVTSVTNEIVTVKVAPRLISNSFSMLKSGALGGIGVAGLPPYMCHSEVEAETLKVVMPQWIPRLGELVALFPTRRGLAPATRAMLDFLKRELPNSTLVSLPSRAKT